VLNLAGGVGAAATIGYVMMRFVVGAILGQPMMGAIFDRTGKY